MRKHQGKTRRRRNYVPNWVTEERIWSDDYCYLHQLEGAERRRRINLWQEDRSRHFLPGPTAWFRRLTHKQSRVLMRNCLIRDLEAFEPVKNIRRFKNPVVWD